MMAWLGLSRQFLVINVIIVTISMTIGLNEVYATIPDEDCLYNTTLTKCAPGPEGECPEGYAMNANEQCFPRHDKCPEGYHSHEDDESGQCINDDIPCEEGYVLNPDFPSCERKEIICQEYPDLNECKDSQVVDDDTIPHW